MPPSLKHYKEFEETLRHYHVSAEGAAELKQLKLVLLLGPSSTGRNTIIRQLVETGRYYHIISDTTRPPRVNDGLLEQNGVDYWFRSEEDILADLAAGNFLEAEIIHQQQVSGISLRELRKAKQESKIAINDVELKGIHNIIKVKPDATIVMLLPPSFEEWQRRFTSRSAMTSTEQQRRLMTAYNIFNDGCRERFYHFVIAEDVNQSAGVIDSIVGGGHNPHQDRGAELVRHLQEELRHRLPL
jgi:guanylate kinase